MRSKEEILNILMKEFERWQELLGGLSDEQMIAPLPGSDMAVKDVIAHLRAWMQVSIARLEAALKNEEPVYPDWLAGSDPESEEEIDLFNARIFETYRNQPWPDVDQDWRNGFHKVLELGDQLPENDLIHTTKYAWMKGYTLMDVLEGAYEHHWEHYESLVD